MHPTPQRERGAGWALGKSGKIYFQTLHEPSFNCNFEERLGRAGDGGKWICNPETIRNGLRNKDGCLVYSVGSNGDTSFETAIHEQLSKECEIHTFDPDDWIMFYYDSDSHPVCPPEFIWYTYVQN